jgi:phage-related holin
MFLTIGVCDSYVAYFIGELNVPDDLCIWWFYWYYQKTIIHTYRQEHSTFSQKLSIKQSYTQIVKNIQRFSEIINRTIIYTNRQAHSTLHWNYQHNYHTHQSSRTFNTSQKLSIKSSYTQTVKKIGVYDSWIDHFWEELNVLDNWCVW